MWLSIIGIVIASLTALYGTVTGQDSTQKKVIQAVFAVAGLIVGMYAAVVSEAERNKEITDHATEVKALYAKLDAEKAVTTEIKRAQSEQEPLLRYVTASVGDLGVLNNLSTGHKYYVRIATSHNDKGRSDLEATKARIEAEFKVSEKSGMVAILPLGSAKGAEELVFGRNLSFAAAEVFLRLALSHHLANGQPQIFSEP